LTAISAPATDLTPIGTALPPDRLFIAGRWSEAESGRTFDSVDPATGQVIARIAEGGEGDVDRAVAAARNAFEGAYGQTTPNDRQRLLHRLADLIEANYEQLTLLDVHDMGAPISNRPASRAGVADVLRYFAGWATKLNGETIPNSLPSAVLSMTLKEPVGVVGAIVPWNGPLDAVMWKLGPALATGCTVVLKPAEDASLTALRIGELATEAGYPDGTVNVVTGYGSVVGAAMAAHRGIDKISFTGSTATGMSIMRAAAGNLKRLTLEMGGKAPDIIFADADLDRAAPAAAIGVFANSGQVCCAGSRIFVERSVYAEVCERIATLSSAMKVGPGIDPSTAIGPIVSARQLARVQGYLRSAEEQGARLVAGGRTLTEGALASGNFVEPTVFADVDDSMTIAQEEIFGPVTSVLAFDREDEVIARANDTTYGLGGGVWTTNSGRALRVASKLRTGTVWVNSYLLFDHAMPFGGYKMSGWGSDLGRAALDGYLNTKSVWLDMS
jgi:aldehyde dehydrogenase (NAD+)